jgi:glycosyltransferase involved in cell wall biosynthesis
MENNIKVSVIVPVYNDPYGIKATIESLLNQDYPVDKYEIIIIDNYSTDSTADVIHSYPVKYLLENKIQTSYAARNKGIDNARGGILALTDSGCIVDTNWIKNGEAAMKDKNVVLGVGKIEFISKNNKMNIYELYDSSTYLKQKNYAKNNFGATANVFVRKKDLVEIGKFNANLISGGDYEMGQRIAKKGRVIYVEEALVKHFARNTFEQLSSKVKRLNRGLAQLIKNNIWQRPNFYSFTYWKPRLRPWRYCAFWKTLPVKDKIFYFFMVNALDYVGKVALYRCVKKIN